MFRNSIYLLIITTICSFTHPVHVSVTNIEYNIVEKKIEIATKVFSADLALALNNYSKNKFPIERTITERDKKWVERYLKSKIEIFINKKNVTKNLKISQMKTDDIYLWIYYEIQEKSEIQHVKIRNTLFLDLFSDQSNLVISSFNKKENAYKFTDTYTCDSLSLN